MAAGKLMRRVMPLAVGVVVALGWSAPPPRVHAILEESTPAAGDTVAVGPTRVMLRFSGPVEESGAMIHVLGPESRMWMLEVSRQQGDARRLMADMPALAPGGYRVAWRVISADGHPIGGDFVFWVGDPANASGDLGEPPPSADPMGTDPTGIGVHADAAQGPHVSTRLIAVRTAVDLALLPLAGLLLFLAWGPGPAMPRTHRTVRMLSVAAPLLAATYTWLWAGETLGAAGSPRLGGLLSLTTGRALAAEAALAALVPWALLLAQRTGFAAVLALLAVGVGGLGGHPASYTPTLALPASVAHVAAAAVWVGGPRQDRRVPRADRLRGLPPLPPGSGPRLARGRRPALRLHPLRARPRGVRARGGGPTLPYPSDIVEGIPMSPRTRAGDSPRPLSIVALVVAATFLWTGSLGAHAVVFPSEAPTGAYQKYVLRVPNEREYATIAVAITFPSGVRVISFDEVAGWTLQTTAKGDGEYAVAVWTGVLPAGRFVEFGFIGVNPSEPTTLKWDVVQTYEDGPEVAWTGPPDSSTPASVTAVVAPAADVEEASAADDSLATVLGAAALVVALISLGLALRRTKPA
jgi:methionine-rich copper-binding protein CopC